MLRSIYYKLIEYELYRRSKNKLKKFRILSANETIDYILEHRCSLSRFGDGEFKQIKAYLNNQGGTSANIGFQKYNPELAKRLYEVATISIANHKVGLPSPLFGISLDLFKNFPKAYWKNQTIYYADFISSALNTKIDYLDSFFSRFYIDYKTPIKAESTVEKIKLLWYERDVLLVEGKYTRFGVGNDLLDGALSVKRIICPPSDAFSRISEIEDAISALTKPGVLVLLALGPTATVVAYDMAKLGFQSIDIGHIDVEYEWMKMGAKEKVPIPGRFVNEARSTGVVENFDDSIYKTQIVRAID